MKSIARRIAAIEAALMKTNEQFVGILQYDGREQTRDDAARGVGKPGLYLVLEAMDLEGGSMLRVRANRTIQWMETADAQVI